jgi:hypothetical protein
MFLSQYPALGQHDIPPNRRFAMDRAGLLLDADIDDRLQADLPVDIFSALPDWINHRTEQRCPVADEID